MTHAHIDHRHKYMSVLETLAVNLSTLLYLKIIWKHIGKRMEEIRSRWFIVIILYFDNILKISHNHLKLKLSM